MSSLIFASCRDCPSYLASAETVRDLFLPAETSVHEKRLPAETLGRKLNHTGSLCRKLFPKHAEVKYDGQSLQDAKIGEYDSITVT